MGATSVTISAPAFGANPLSAFGTTSVTATVTGGGTGSQTVNFTSACNSSGKAFLSTGITTVSGVATGSYRDNGCAATDTITATVSGGLATNSANLVVTAPTTGSIQYVSSAPTTISLKGTGGIEVSQVTFKVLSTGGNPLSGQAVTFALSTSVGGITLTPGGTATSDSNGLVVTNVNAGTVSTPVRVTATTTGSGGVTLSTQSSQLAITTGIPDQFGFSLAASTHNIEGWTKEGTTSVLTARLADHFKNPVPDGTAVVFTSEGSTIVGSCTTVAGTCSSTYTSSGTRPSSITNGFGRVTVLATAVGEETFTDLSGDGWADLAPTNEMIDPNVNATDLPEAYVDYNENGSRDAATEPYLDFNGNGSYDVADGKFSGVLCDDVTAGRSSAGTCSTNKTIHVRKSQVIVLSDSFAVTTVSGGAPMVVAPCDLINGNEPTDFTVTVVDANGNAMPAGTTIVMSTDNGTITAGASSIVPDTIGCRTGYPGCPATAASATFGDIPVSIKSDATYTPAVLVPATAAVCSNSTPSGTFTVTVTTPGGFKTMTSIHITD